MQNKLQSSPYCIEILKDKNEWFLFLVFMLCILCWNLFSAYKDYQFYLQDQPISAEFEVKLQYDKFKNHHHYFVLKIQDLQQHFFYTTSREKLKDLLYRKVKIFGKMKKCSFKEFLKGCYFSAYKIILLPQVDYKKPLRDFVNRQHQDTDSALLYRALFFGDSINLKWRKFSNVTGIAHLIAISGFHLGILSSVLYCLIFPFYSFLQKRYFTYRNLSYDLGLVVLLGMLIYLIFLEYQPAFFRAFLMAVMGYIFYLSGIRILSFKMLFIVIISSLAFFPSFIFNIGFILSIFGVFYIFLFIKHIDKKSWWSYLIFFNIAIFLLMGIVVHFYFPYFSPYQMIAIILSILFVIYFPLVIGLHLFGYGDLLDFVYIWALKQEIVFINFSTPSLLFWIYISLSLLAIIFKWCFNLVLLMGFGFYLFLILRFFGILSIGIV